MIKIAGLMSKEYPAKLVSDENEHAEKEIVGRADGSDRLTMLFNLHICENAEKTNYFSYPSVNALTNRTQNDRKFRISML